MIKNIFKLIMLCSVVFIGTSCEEDDPTGHATRLGIVGNSYALPESTGSYFIGIPDLGATWETSDASVMTITSQDGTSAEVSFLSAGDVRLTATAGSRVGFIDITVEEVGVGVSVEYAGTGKLKSGDSDTVFFTFDSPLASTPTISINTDSSGFTVDANGDKVLAFTSTGDAISALTAVGTDMTEFYAIYTAGAGDGQPEAMFATVTVVDAYGGEELDSVYAWLPVVDNTIPYAEVSFSEDVVNDSTEVTITVTFSEAVMPTMATAADTLIFIDISGGGVATVKDTLWATDDASVWTLSYLTNGDGDGPMTATVDFASVVDLAKNAPTVGSGTLTIDNTPPAAAGFGVSSDGLVVTVELTAGAGDEIAWTYVEDGETAPVAADFASAWTEGDVFSLAAGDYDFYYMVTDEAGNSTTVQGPVDLTVAP